MMPMAPADVATKLGRYVASKSLISLDVLFPESVSGAVKNASTNCCDEAVSLVGGNVMKGRSLTRSGSGWLAPRGSKTKNESAVSYPVDEELQ